MKFCICSIFVLFFAFNSLAQRGDELLDTSDNSRQFNSYIAFEVRIVDFENSLYVNDFKTTEFKIENGMIYSINKLIGVSFGINGGVILGIPYENRLQAYFNSGNSSGLDTFLKYYDEINFIDQTLAKTRYFIGFHPQLNFNINKKWKLQAGTEMRYYFQPFFDERSYFGNTYKEDGVHFDFLGNLGISYLLKDQLSIGLNYNRSFGNLRRALILNSYWNEPYTSSMRYHSLGLNVTYSF
ncbi:hypothetical protein QYS49_37765 [Marivirga salinae]|uniref:Outer membrane protein beta-barrel domain-containing protein n=1 Tax=Marivirga salinarum TaxID=3059078 RepID=A0AA51NCU9_9BACT|nr:hypothetical protein [Marivirga sp. BDSF4-3]WMN11260.1 hypothetical protein QYS49_37765 [Marivirga sp. BDSF4-3]